MLCQHGEGFRTGGMKSDKILKNARRRLYLGKGHVKLIEMHDRINVASARLVVRSQDLECLLIVSVANQHGPLLTLSGYHRHSREERGPSKTDHEHDVPEHQRSLSTHARSISSGELASASAVKPSRPSSPTSNSSSHTVCSVSRAYA